MIKRFALALTALVLLVACGEDSPTRHNDFAPLTAINLTATPSALAPGTSVQVTAEGVFDGFTRPITDECTWESLNDTIVTVDATGRVRALAPGAASIRAYRGAIAGELPMTVNNVTITAVTVIPTGVTPPATASIPKGRTQAFTAVGTFSDGTTQDITSDVIWQSSTAAAEAVAGQNGVFRGVAVTEAASPVTITAIFPATNGGTETPGSAPLAMTAAVVDQVTIDPPSANILPGGTQQFTASGRFSDGSTAPITGVTWASTPTSVATISTTGLATAVGTGTATITATVQGLPAATAELAIAVPTRIDISQPTGTIRVGTQPFNLTATAVFADNRTQDVTQLADWSPTATTGAASVSNSSGTKGRVTVHRAGTVTIQATIHGVTGSREITVTNGG